MPRSFSRSNPQITFVALALIVNLAASGIVRAVTDPARHHMVQYGAFLDMTVTVTALYYWLVVRPGIRSKSTLLLIAAMGIVRASIALPGVIPTKAWIAIGVEFAIVSALLFRARRVITGELAVLYCAFAWWARPDVPHGARTFTVQKQSGIHDTLLLAGLASLLEVVPAHLVIAHWSVIAAWVATAITLYGAIFVFALSRSIGLRPCLIIDDAIVIRLGLLFSLKIPAGCVASLGSEPVPGAVVIPRNAEPNLFIRFHRPLTAEKLFGITKQVNAIALSTDEPPVALFREFPRSAQCS